MNCPEDKNQKMDKLVVHNVEADYCSLCEGVWFEKDELRKVKDEKAPQFNWLDTDLWSDKKKFKIKSSVKVCPQCQVPLYEVEYEDSGIKIDICNLCQGSFLQKKEFAKITDYIKEKGMSDLSQEYWQNLAKEGVEIFTGPEKFKSELKDFLMVLSFFNARFAVKHPIISQIIANLPK